MALYIVKPWYKKQAAPAPIYGAEWAGTSSPAWTRTDAAASFADPSPYYAGMSDTPSSPFDNIMPWSGLRRVTDSNAGELVEIPKFYYKWTRDGAKMKLQISTQQHSGFICSPAHADRGDGVGERDYAYVGRYHCAGDYKSTTGVKPKETIARATFRGNIHSLGANVWQFDFAMHWTIALLYLVEFASWNIRSKIGYGCGNSSGTENMGATDSMPYHTGTMSAARTTLAVGVQYRYIEDLWANVLDNIDGLYISSTTIYCTKNPADFSDTSGGTAVGTSATSRGIPAQFTNPTISGFEYALFPSSVDPNGNNPADTYTCDYYDYGGGTNCIYGGGSWFLGGGINSYFYKTCSPASSAYNNIGSRLMVLPPSRLT